MVLSALINAKIPKQEILRSNEKVHVERVELCADQWIERYENIFLLRAQSHLGSVNTRKLGLDRNNIVSGRRLL